MILLSKQRTKPPLGERGFTLVEMLIAITVFAIAVGVAFVLYNAAQSSYKEGEQFTEQQQNTRVAFDRLVEDLGIVDIPPEVPVDADPGHLAAVEHVFLADDRDIVLGLAGQRAGVAADAGVQVDRHAPGVPGGGVLPVQGHIVRRVVPFPPGEVGVRFVFL